MARLNESTASAEPIEILKRRFVRQNREIARVNSIQSLRIRSLESEVSHLLSENVALREQVITLTQDLERFEAARTLHDGVYDVKARLDGKLVELSSLITELGSLPRRHTREAREKAEPSQERQPRESHSTGQLNDADEEPRLEFESHGKLPVILEDKYYPRRTLSAQDIQELANSDEASPDFSALADSARSPEHIARHEEGVTSTSADSTDPNITVGDMEQEHFLPPNLETRRKKRMGSTAIDQEQTDTKSTSLLDSRFVRKCGAKRKFSAEDEESLFESAQDEDDDFEFSRPAQSPEFPPQRDPSPTKQKPQSIEIVSHVQPRRKVLEPKSTNTYMPSPVKPSFTKIQDRQPHQVSIKSDENSAPHHGKTGLKRSKISSPKKPSTPIPSISEGTNHIFKETTAEMATNPQPDVVDHSESPATADPSNTRTSRRRGAVVSYAEPNLRDKMRRSTNELGPAVNRNKSRKSSLHADPGREPHEQKRKSSITKKARNSSITNAGHDSTGDEKPEDHWDTVTNDRSNNIGGQPHDLDAGSEELQGGSTIDDGHHEQHRAHDPYRGPGFSVDVDQAISVTNRKSRRHSSNTKTAGRGVPSKHLTRTIDVEGVCNELANELSKAEDFSTRDSQEYTDAPSLMGSTGMTRGQRVAARRRSMML